MPRPYNVRVRTGRGRFAKRPYNVRVKDEMEKKVKPFYELVKRPIITEKSMALKEANNTYCFEVSKEATKGVVAKAMEDYFKVKVTSVRTLIMRGHMKRVGKHQGRRPNWKKAIITLAKGQKIEILESKS